MAGWVSLFLMHTIWPFLWIWAYLYKPGEGWGTETIQIEPSEELKSDIKKLEELEKKVKELEKKLHSAESENKGGENNIETIIKVDDTEEDGA